MRWIRAGETRLDADRIAGFSIREERDRITFSGEPQPAFFVVDAILDAGGTRVLESFEFDAVKVSDEHGGVWRKDAEKDARAYVGQLERELADHKAARDPSSFSGVIASFLDGPKVCGVRSGRSVPGVDVSFCVADPGHAGPHSWEA